MDSIRLIHVSDVHLSAPAHWSLRDWCSKRLTGWLHWRLGRGQQFRQADTLVTALTRHLQQGPPDAVVFSGDATVLGFEDELARAAQLLGVVPQGPWSGFAVPGNHDYYTPSVAASGLFERAFAPWQAGVRIDGGHYPFARRIGHVWLVGVNSCAGNHWPHDACGVVGRAQLERLERLLGQLPPGPRVLVTHYPFALADGQPEKFWHGLRDVAELAAVARAGGVALWLHGHRHHPYRLRPAAGRPCEVVCAGSLTQTGCQTFEEYVIAGHEGRAVRHRYCPAEERFVPEETYTFVLK